MMKYNYEILKHKRNEMMNYDENTMNKMMNYDNTIITFMYAYWNTTTHDITISKSSRQRQEDNTYIKGLIIQIKDIKL